MNIVHCLIISLLRYNVLGLELGETKIVFYSGKGEKMIRSSAVNIQVSVFITL